MTDQTKLEKYLDVLRNKKTGNITSLKIASKMTEFGLLPTPFPSLNTLIGGIPIARFTTIAGPEHTGKGAFCLQLIAYLQSIDPEFIALWTDAESSLDLAWAEKLGVDLDRLIVSTYDETTPTMESLLDSCLNIITSTKLISLWVVDSIGALLPKDDVIDSKGEDKALEGTKMLNLQKKLGEFFRKANIKIAPRDGYKGCAVLMLGQIYTVPEANATLTEVRGGNSVKHWAHLRLGLRRGPRADWPEKVKVYSPDGNIREIFPGWSGRFKIEKTRINANEGKEILLTFNLGKGFDSASATICAALGFGIITRSGAYYNHKDFPNGKIHSRKEMFSYIEKTPELISILAKEVNEKALTSAMDEQASLNPNE